jgi:2-oxo-4-hydroxy-4-carboxy-5-ureidoimidazoline decarboxylase
MRLKELNALAEPAAREALTSCSGTPRWVARMLAARPFASREAVMRASDDAWLELTLDDLNAAIVHHPRIGETATAAAGHARASGWAVREQAGALSAPTGERTALARANEEYERRFGHRFIICATGLSADDMLAALRARLANDPPAELAVTSDELRKITALRLDKLLSGE